MSGAVVDCDLSGFAVRFRGLPDELAARLREEWAAFVLAGAGAAPFLELDVERVAGALRGGPYDPKGMRARLTPARATFAMDEGDAELAPTGAARLRLVAGTGEREWFTLLNLFRACLAWRLPTRHAALVHAAGIVVGARGYVLIGGAGAGKSTFARLAGAAGATVVSDDVVVLDAGADPVTLAAAPLRSTLAVAWRRGRWPVAALLLPRHGAVPALGPATPLALRAKLTANLPFVAAALESDPRIGDVVERLVSGVPGRELTFAPDAGFLALLGERP